jgi:uncharacterized protein YecE (DUF72 family)
MATTDVAQIDRIDRFDFRGFRRHLLFGTASDRYAGWIGQIYPEHHGARAKTRYRKLGDASFTERTIPVESVADFFNHFDILELDFTFYRPLLEKNGKPTNNFHVLERYADHAPETASFLLKAPRDFFARTIRKGSAGKVTYVPNPDYLNSEALVKQFWKPAEELLGERLRGVIFEQEYQQQQSSPDPRDHIAELDGFAEKMPRNIQSHFEIRSPHLLAPEYFDWLETVGIGFVFSHWTWLPPLRKQWKMAGARFTSTDGSAVVRLLTPLNVSYAEAYALTHPFDAPVPRISESAEGGRMLDDVATISSEAERSGGTLMIVANNRAWGSAPALAQSIARRIIREESLPGD